MKLTRRQLLKRIGLAGGVVLLGSYPIFIERYLIKINRYRIAVPRLPKAFTGFTIIQLSDIHYGPLVPKVVVQYVVDTCNRLKKDLVVCTGDYVHERNSINQVDQVWPILSGLEAHQGVYSILGNHDHWADTARSQYWLERTGQNLRNRVISIDREGERLWIAGTGDYWEDCQMIDPLVGNIPPEDCRILLAHNPDTADTDFAAPIDLMICGHTHGGQVNIPFIGAPILPVKNKTYTSGLKQSSRGTRIFISRGIGWAIFPIRFNCSPEIAILELVASTPEKA